VEVSDTTMLKSEQLLVTKEEKQKLERLKLNKEILS